MNFTWLYVGVLYALAVWLARRARLDLPRTVAAIFYLLVLVFLWRPLTEPVVSIPADIIKLTQPWSELRAPGRGPVSKYDVSNLNLQDVPMQIAPWMHQVRESWRALDPPLWNAANGAGYPLLANGQSTALAPLRILTLPLSLDRAMAAEGAMKLLIALVLTYLFCRRRYSPEASLLAAIAYAFSTWMTVWLQFPISGAAAFLPGVFLVIDLLLEGVTASRFAAAALMFSVTVVSGQPETVSQIGLFSAAFGVWVAIFEYRSPLRVVRSVLPAAFVAALLASPFLLPFAEAVVRSERLAHVRDRPEITMSPFPPFETSALLLQPTFFGELPIERPWRGGVVSDSICGFAGVLAVVAAVSAPIFIIRRRRWRERETLYILAVFVCLAVVLDWRLISDAFHAVAGLAPTHRMRFGICWFASILIAAAVDWARKDSRAPLLVGALMVSAAMALLLRITPFPTPSHRASALLSFLPSMAVLAAVALLPMKRRLAIAVVGALAFVDLWSTVDRWTPLLPRRDLYPTTPLINLLRELRDHDAMPFRIVGTGGQLYPNTAVMYGFEDVRVHDPLASIRYLQFLHAQIGWEPTNYYEKWNDTDTTILDLLNVKYVVTEAHRGLSAPRYEQRYSGRDGRIYTNRNALPLFFPVRNVLFGGDPATHTDWKYTALVSRVPRRYHDELAAPWSGDDARVQVTPRGSHRYTLRVQAPRTTLVVSSIENYPGWRAADFPIVEVNGLFVGIIVPRGDHAFDVVYRPLSFYASAVVSLLTLLVLIVQTVRARSVRPAIAAPPQNDSGA